MIRARFSPKAARDLDGIALFISPNDPEAAKLVRNAILGVADVLAQQPGLGRQIRNASPRHAQIRWFVVPKFRNYLLFYQPFNETVLVVRVLHAAQDWTRFFPPTDS
jgi:plasmid stabilization system protein ParE